MKNLNLKDIKECFELYKVAFNKNPHIKDLAKELSVNPTTLMKFIEDNDIHFRLYKGSIGSFISEVYFELKDTPGTDEFVEYNKEKYKNTLFLYPYKKPYYDNVDFHRLIEDKKDKERSNEWRNTPEKIEKISKFLVLKEVCIGSLVEGINKYFDYIPKENIELLISQGWEFVNYNEKADE